MGEEADAVRAEFERRADQLSHLLANRVRYIRRELRNDLEIFEAAFFELNNADFEGSIESAPGSAAMLRLTVEHLVNEHGEKATAAALYFVAQALEKPS